MKPNRATDHLISALVMLMTSLLATAAHARDGKAPEAYKTVTIGSTEWMAENLDVATFRNGDAIPEAKTADEWLAASRTESPAWCYYNNDPKNGARFGRLYNWYAVNDSRGLAPAGWRIPSDKDWQALMVTYGGTSAAFAALKKADGFAALPAGARYFKDGSFNHAGNITFWWSATKKDKWNASYHAMHFGMKEVASDDGGMNTGHSVRCVRDEAAAKKSAGEHKRITIGHFTVTVPEGWNSFSDADRAEARREFSTNLAPGLEQYERPGGPTPRMGDFEIYQKPTDGQLIGWTLVIPDQSDFLKEILKREDVQFQQRKSLSGGRVRGGSCRLVKAGGYDVVRVDAEMVDGGKSTNLHFWSPKSPGIVTILMVGTRSHRSDETEKGYQSIVSSLAVSEELEK